MKKDKPIFLWILPAIGRVLLMVILSGGFTEAAVAQDAVGKKDSIHSDILNETRFIHVILPEKYKPGSGDKYDVIYVLDGDWNAKTMLPVTHFLEDEGRMPPVILIGVDNIFRDKDFTPTHVSDPGISGGAGKFLSFLKNELIPYVNKTYPANGDNILFGHSYGGLFVLYALLNEPRAFRAYLAADPSLWWDNEYMNKEAKKKLALLPDVDRSLFISGREGKGMQEMAILPMDTILQKNAPGRLTWKISAYPDETHGSVRLKSMYDGLKFTYGGYNSGKIAFHPMNGLLLKDSAISIWYFDNPEKIRYTLDGSMPTASSPKIRNEFKITGPARLTARLFTSRERYDKITVGEFAVGLPLPAGPKPKKENKPGGFRYSYYEGDWSTLPDFTTLKPIASGITDSSFHLEKMPRQDHFALLIEGELAVKENGYYIFALDSDDGSRLSLGDRVIIDYDSLHAGGSPRSYILPLQKGFYPFRLEYFQKEGGRTLKCVYLTPDLIRANNPTKPVPLPFQFQYGHR